jgi:hypothetical protein
VQHDGDGRRCRVACRFAPILDRDFEGDLSPQKSTSLRQTKRTLRKFVEQDSFRLRVHGRYGLTAGTAAFPGHSISRITCSNLVEADDDFDRQYFQVIR